MPRFNVKSQDGKWACFSSITDSYITKFMYEKQYDKWRKLEYGRCDYRPICQENRNIMSVEESIFSICLNRNEEESIHELKLVGLDTPENLTRLRNILKENEEE